MFLLFLGCLFIGWMVSLYFVSVNEHIYTLDNAVRIALIEPNNPINKLDEYKLKE